MKTMRVGSGAVVAALALMLAKPALAGVVTGTAVTSAIGSMTTAACIASIGPQAVFTGLACATGWAAIGISWLLPF